MLTCYHVHAIGHSLAQHLRFVMPPEDPLVPDAEGFFSIRRLRYDEHVELVAYDSRVISAA